MSKSIIEKLGITPGPLHVETLSKNCYSIVEESLDDLMNCVSDNEDEPTYFGGIYKKVDADIFAAAPEMLEALIEFCLRVDRYEVRSKKTYSQFKAIIQKATGKTWEEIKELLK